MNKIGADRFRQLLQIRMADIKAHAEGTQQSRIERCMALGEILEDTLSKEQCFSMKDMQINGHDIMALGVQEGKQVGYILKRLLDDVINDRLENKHMLLVEASSSYIRENG